MAQLMERFTGDRSAGGSNLTVCGVTVFLSSSKTLYLRLVLIHPRKTHPDMIEKLLTGALKS